MSGEMQAWEKYERLWCDCHAQVSRQFCITLYPTLFYYINGLMECFLADLNDYQQEITFENDSKRVHAVFFSGKIIFLIGLLE